LLTKPIPFGLSALVFALAGYAVGLLPDAIYEGRWTTRSAVIAAATGAGGVLYAAAATVFGVPNLSVAHVTAVVIVLAVSGFALAPVFLRIMLWVLMAGERARA
jgi:hypothetical protein